MWQKYIHAASIKDVLANLNQYGAKARIIAGATDLTLELERGVRSGIEVLIDISRIKDLNRVYMDDNNRIHLGPLVTHGDCVASPLLREYALPLVLAAHSVGAPQIRNLGTVAGNIITASPANDTITPLMALGAEVTLASIRGERVVPLDEFYKGVRKTVMQDDEMLIDIAFPALQPNQHGTFVKLGLRKAQAISVVNVAIVLTYTDDMSETEFVEDCQITLGAVAPTIIHATKAEEYLRGKALSDEVIYEAASLASEEAKPITDIRGSKAYRKEMVKVLTTRGLRDLMQGTEKNKLPKRPVLLRSNCAVNWMDKSITIEAIDEIVTKINGKVYKVRGDTNKSLLRLLREDIVLTGTKEGCAEGECGACTVFLDGMAVMSCLVPAPRAHMADITTIEGIGHGESLSPVQQAFVDEGAVQCGYCIPGFIMSAEKLLEEIPVPDTNEIKEAITGNLCRCTGYYKIIRAIEQAAKRS